MWVKKIADGAGYSSCLRRELGKYFSYITKCLYGWVCYSSQLPLCLELVQERGRPLKPNIASIYDFIYVI